MMIDWNNRYGYPAFAVESVGFQHLYEGLLSQKGAVIDYRESKVSNRTIKQGLMNRMRVWFERELVCFPYGDDFTRKQVNILLEELENHAWREGLIEDLGRHNDIVMALAHALDQFTHKTPDVPVIMATMKRGEWIGGGKSVSRANISGVGGGVIRRYGNE
jgi:hypothetical protein